MIVRHDREDEDFGIVELDPDFAPLTVLAKAIARANRPPWWKRILNFILRRKPPPLKTFEWEEDELMPRITTLRKTSKPGSRVFYPRDQIFREGDVVRFSEFQFGGQVIEVRPTSVVMKPIGTRVAIPAGAEMFLVSNAPLTHTP